MAPLGGLLGVAARPRDPRQVRHRLRHLLRGLVLVMRPGGWDRERGQGTEDRSQIKGAGLPPEILDLPPF